MGPLAPPPVPGAPGSHASGPLASGDVSTSPGRRSNLPLLLGLLGVVVVLAVIAVVLVSQRRDEEPALDDPARTALSIPAGPRGTQHFEGLSAFHQDGRIHYEQVPPAGGDHAPIWWNCGTYEGPIPVEQAVHSLEHGAVWITYDPELPERDRQVLAAYGDPYGFVLVSPWHVDDRGALPAKVVASAWGVQLAVDSATDERLAEFVETFAAGPQTPEPGAPCTGGNGQPMPR